MAVIGVDGGEVRFRDRVSNRLSTAQRCGHELHVGDEVVVELARVRGGLRIVRVLSTPRPQTQPDPAMTCDENLPGILVGGVPLARPSATRPDDVVAVGQVRTAEFRFSARTTAERDAGTVSKRRPCVVVDVDGDHAAVCPIHGTNSAVRRSGSGRRLVGWRALGLRKPSVVSAESTWIPIAQLGPLVGVLEERDRNRLVPGEMQCQP